jgi:ribosome-associated protein
MPGKTIQQLPNISGESMQVEALRDLVIKTLDDMKAQDIKVLDVRGKTSITDIMVIASGTSDRHVKSLAETVAFQAKEAGETPLGIEGANEGEWALVDLNSVVVHVMQSKVRDFYQLERLWSMDAPDSNDLAATAEHS